MNASIPILWTGLLVGCLLAQNPQKPESAESRPTSPFTADDTLRGLLDSKPSGAPGAPARPADEPSIALRALVKMGGKERTAALLEIDEGHLVRVREGDALDVWSARGNQRNVRVAVRVTRVEPDRVELEVGPKGEKWVLR